MRQLALFLVFAILTLSCSGEPPGDFAGTDALDAGVTRTLAVARAHSITDVHYDYSLSIPAARTAAITGRLKASFELSNTSQPLVFDFAQPEDHVKSVAVAGEPTGFEVINQHIVIPPSSLHEGANVVEIEFIAGDGSLNRSDDYLYTLFVPDRARVALPIFDQPDLKARNDLHLEVPIDWQAVADGALVEHKANDDSHTFHFRQRDPIPTYLLAFAAGKFEVETAQRGTRLYRMLHRETDAAKVARNLDAIFDLHHAALQWLEDYTGIDYPFEKFDFALIPDFQYGGMEHPGAIFYRDRSLFLDEPAKQSQLLGRASLIAHETAHMWFGNLVTMEWFNDVWMKEVMANFMAAKIVNPTFPKVNHELRFLLAHYPSAYRVDRTPGANPIRQELLNLNEAGSLYGAIIYQKAPIVMQHLELLLGKDLFQQGIREYLDANRYGNATWTDLITVMDAKTKVNLEAWSETWVNEAGRPTVKPRIEVKDGVIVALNIEQSDPQDQGRLWTQPLQLLLGNSGSADRWLSIDLDRETVAVGEAVAQPAPDFLLLNGKGIGYGNFALDPASRDYLLQNLPTIPDARTRAIAWLALQDAMLSNQVTPSNMLDLAMRALTTESDELNSQLLLDSTSDIFWRYLTEEQRIARAPQVEGQLWSLVESATKASLKSSLFSAYRNVALSTDALDRLHRLWQQTDTIPDLPLSETDMTDLAQSLALRGIASAEDVLDQQFGRITNADRQARFTFARPALSADPLVRERFFNSLKEAKEREQERWVLQALRFLHHPLRAESSRHLILPSLKMLEEVQRTGDIFFPLGWLAATLSGHSSVDAARIVRDFLDQATELPPRLRGKLLQAADPLLRAAELRSGSVAR